MGSTTWLERANKHLVLVSNIEGLPWLAVTRNCHEFSSTTIIRTVNLNTPTLVGVKLNNSTKGHARDMTDIDLDLVLAAKAHGRAGRKSGFRPG